MQAPWGPLGTRLRECIKQVRIPAEEVVGERQRFHPRDGVEGRPQEREVLLENSECSEIAPTARLKKRFSEEQLRGHAAE
jgi:hypothetical protein